MIEQLQEKDIELISELYIDTFGSPPWNEVWEKGWAVERLSLILSSIGSEGLIYRHEENIVGAILGRLNSFKGKKEFEILELFVKPDFQRNKIGESLLTGMEQRMKSKGVTNFTLLTSRKVGAYEFYKKFNFKTGENMVFMYHST